MKLIKNIAAWWSNTEVKINWVLAPYFPRSVQRYCKHERMDRVNGCDRCLDCGAHN